MNVASSEVLYASESALLQGNNYAVRTAAPGSLGAQFVTDIFADGPEDDQGQWYGTDKINVGSAQVINVTKQRVLHKKLQGLEVVDLVSYHDSEGRGWLVDSADSSFWYGSWNLLKPDLPRTDFHVAPAQEVSGSGSYVWQLFNSDTPQMPFDGGATVQGDFISDHRLELELAFKMHSIATPQGVALDSVSQVHTAATADWLVSASADIINEPDSNVKQWNIGLFQGAVNVVLADPIASGDAAFASDDHIQTIFEPRAQSFEYIQYVSLP